MKKCINIVLLFILIFQCFFINSCNKSVDNIENSYIIADCIYDIKNYQKISHINDNKYLLTEINRDRNNIASYSLSIIDLTSGEKSECMYNLPDGATYKNACCDENGNLYILTNNSGNKIYKYSPAGELISEYEYSEIASSIILLNMYAHNDEIILIFDNGIKNITTNKEILINKELLLSCIHRTENNFYIYFTLVNEYDDKPSDNSIAKYDAAENKFTWDVVVPENIYSYNICYDYTNSLLIIASDSNIYTINPENGKLIESIVNIYDYTSTENVEFLLSGSENIYLLTKDVSEETVYIRPIRIATEEDIAVLNNSKQTTITIRAFSWDKLMTIALKKYALDNNIKIIFDYYSDTETNDTTGYVQNTNAALLSGKSSWDIVMLYKLDYNLYSSKGYFVDLYTLGAKELIESDEYFVNIINAFEKEGKLYSFPNNFQTSSLYIYRDMYDKLIKGSKSWEEIFENFDKYASENEYLFSPQYLFYMHAYSLYNLGVKVNNMMNEKTSKNDVINEITHDLNIVNKIFDSRYTCPSDNSENHKYVFEFNHSSSISSLISSTLDLTNISMINLPAISKGDSYCFNMLNGMAILNTSKNKEEAYKILKYISQNEVSFANYTYKEMFYKKQDDELNEYIINGSNKTYTLTESQKEELKRIHSESLQVMENVTVQIPAMGGAISIIREETDKFTEGLLTVEETAANIYERLWLYYNE